MTIKTPLQNRNRTFQAIRHDLLDRLSETADKLGSDHVEVEPDQVRSRIMKVLGVPLPAINTNNAPLNLSWARVAARASEKIAPRAE